MKKNLLPLFASLFAALALAVSLPALAANSPQAAELSFRTVRSLVSYTINEDGTFVEYRERAVKILEEKAVSWMKSASVSHSTSIQTADIVEAYTEKPDGRKIEAPKSNYQIEVNGGKGKDSPVYSDRTTVTVVFPDVAVGDTLVFTYRLTATQPLFPRHFSLMENFDRDDAYDDVRIRIDYPDSMWVQHRAHELTETRNTLENGRHLLEWVWKNPEPLRNKRKNYSAFDVEKEPGFSFSTFRNYVDIVNAYGERARPKAAVTERTKKLAEEISGDRTDTREIARALYDWVSVNISYAGNCIGLGAVVPRDMDFVLDNKMGDCKDHATLLQALLAAKGIRSSQALINSGSAYRLPTIPVVSMVNHVINYIPGLDLYVDSTSDSTPFGLLPFPAMDKPVLLVDSYRDGSKTPSLPPGTNDQTMKTVIHVQPDGSIKGEVQVALKGMYAAGARSRFRNMPKETEAEFVKNVFRSVQQNGDGIFSKDDAKERLDTFNYGATFEVKNVFSLPGAGAFPIAPVFYNMMPVAHYVGHAFEEVDEHEVACSNGRSAEEYTINFPKNMKIISVPANLKLKNDFLSYSASYVRKGNSLIVKRVFDDRTQGNLCAPAIFAAYKEFAQKVVPDLKAQVVYK